MRSRALSPSLSLSCDAPSTRACPFSYFRRGRLSSGCPRPRAGTAGRFPSWCTRCASWAGSPDPPRSGSRATGWQWTSSTWSSPPTMCGPGWAHSCGSASRAGGQISKGLSGEWTRRQASRVPTRHWAARIRPRSGHTPAFYIQGHVDGHEEDGSAVRGQRLLPNLPVSAGIAAPQVVGMPALGQDPEGGWKGPRGRGPPSQLRAAMPLGVRGAASARAGGRSSGASRRSRGSRAGGRDRRAGGHHLHRRPGHEA